MKNFITPLFLALFLVAPAFAQEIPEDLKAKLEAKSAQINANNPAKIKSWVKKQTEAWETIQNMAFSADDNDVKLIKTLAEKKFPLDYVAQEPYISEQAAAASGLADFKTQLGSAAYNALKNKFTQSGNTDLNTFVELLQTESAAKMEIDSMTTDKMRPRTFALIKRVAAEEFPGNFVEQLSTIKEILSGKPHEAQAADGGERAAEHEAAKRPATMSELEKIIKQRFVDQTYMTDGDTRAAVMLAEMQGRQVAFIPFNSYTPGVTLSNARGEPLEYNENDVYVSKRLPLVLVFPKGVPENAKNAAFINDKQYRDLVGSTLFVVGYLKQNLTSFPVRINSINEKYVLLNVRLPVNYCEGTLVLDPKTQDTVAVVMPATPKVRKINWMQRSEVNRLTRELEQNALLLEARRLDNFGKWEKFSADKFIEQRMNLDRAKAVSADFVKLFTITQLSDSENSPVIGAIVKKHINTLKKKMEKSSFERAYKSYMLDLANLLKAELRELKSIDFYSGFEGEANKYIEVLEQVLKTLDTASKSQAYLTLVQEDVKQRQGF